MTNIKHSQKVLSAEQTFYRSMDVTDKLLFDFGELSGDHNPFHTDNNYAKKKGYKNTVSYGNLLGLMVSSLVGESMSEYGVLLISQNLNFRQPFYLGDRINLTATISTYSETLEVGEVKLTFKNQFGKTCASGTCMVKCLA